jgi:hypothetical protein
MERLMRIASAENPKAAFAEHRAKDAEEHRAARAKRNGADVGSNPIEHILQLIDELVAVGAAAPPNPIRTPERLMAKTRATDVGRNPIERIYAQRRNRFTSAQR